MLRYIDSRFAEGFEDVSHPPPISTIYLIYHPLGTQSLDGGSIYTSVRSQHFRCRFTALCPKRDSCLSRLLRCIYFLDPDDIVPPSVPGPPAPLVPRARTNSFSHQSDVEPVILEPPVTNLPLLCRPTLPPSDITTIRRLSARVNVLPVIAKADMLSNDRLAAIKLAIRRDLASAGIGFGIFDMDTPITNDDHLQSSSSSMKNEPNGYPGHPNGSASANITPPGSPVTPLLRLPYALISPDIYSHSDGVPRVAPSRHELVIQYTPSSAVPSAPKLPRGKYIRSYRWGSMDVLDPMHNDFVPLRAAVFHHMEVTVLPVHLLEHH